jgi:hypothetical protein
MEEVKNAGKPETKGRTNKKERNAAGKDSSNDTTEAVGSVT